MTIKDTLRWSVILSVFFSLAMIVLMFYASTYIDAAIKRGRSADAIVKNAYDLNALTEEYLTLPSERVLEQWQATHQHIGELLDAQDASDAESKDLLSALHEKNDDIAVSFAGNVQRSSLPRLTEREATQFRINAQAMVVDASRLSALSFADQDYSQRLIEMLLIGLTIVFATGTISIMSILYRRITGPLSKLRTGADRIAAGDFNQHLDTSSNDEFGEVAGSFNSMAERLRATHHELEEKIKELSDQDEKKNTFISVLSHELRNPLAPIVSSVEYARELRINNPELNEVLDVIGRQSANMKLLLEDLLDVSRMIQGKIELRKRNIDVRELVRHAIQTAEPHIKVKGQKVEVSLSDEPVFMHADPLRIEQMITNLLGNASKYSPKGSSISLTLSRKGNMANIYIRDKGIGVAKELQEKIFDIFYQVQANAADGPESGFGIGLPLSRTLAQMHGGSISMHSEGVGKGSEFVISLPLA